MTAPIAAGTIGSVAISSFNPAQAAPRSETGTAVRRIYGMRGSNGGQRSRARGSIKE